MMIAATSYAPATTHATEAAKRSGTSAASDTGARAAAPQAEAQKPPVVVFNPRSHFDSEAGVFVMEFRSARTGEIERRFPDEQQLKAYRQAAVSKSSGPQPAAVVV
ncbi:hypothetical protein [Azospirillum sp. TSO22-1]|uniref:hypothetical protein n=1 Tax=Azospirillum sp. TSO22-1 TaxID=716789 RepID=UPI000D619F35|nr:hypothetical protein [Azospirillum sp. TSO22-1]PWC44261.1 hypothetical protein TSO221_18370 [Azospirillum sp. TSO22-1]